MSMRTHVIGIKPPDAQWKKMKAVYDACRDAGVYIPAEVAEFFGPDAPDDAGVVVEEDELETSGALTAYKADMVDGFEVDVDKLPPGVKIIRFYNSY